MPLQKPYVKDVGRVLTPVYAPGESYAFVINGAYYSDPNLSNLDLQIWDTDNNVIKSGFAQLTPIFAFGASPLYVISCNFSFPYSVPNGFYRFVIWTYAEDREVLRSNPILVESEVLNTTMRLEFSHDEAIYGVPYDKITGGGVFVQRFRLPLAQIDLQFEQEKTTYRNVTDRRLRTLKSYRDNNFKIEARGFDDEGNEALSAVLDHRYVQVNGLAVEPKTALTISTTQIANTQKASFEVYANTPERQYGIFAGYGDLLILCGDSVYNPDLLYQSP